MTIDAVLVAIKIPHKIHLESQDNDLYNLYEMISNTTEPIVSLDIVKKNFDINNYQIHTHNKQLNSPEEYYKEWNKSIDYSKVPDYINKIFESENERIKALNGKQYINLEKDDIRNLFSLEKWRENQLDKLI